MQRLLILLLLVLQGFTPLVHAHARFLDGLNQGAHIHNVAFEAHPSAHGVTLDACALSGPVIDMQAAIQQKKILEGDLELATLVALVHDFLRTPVQVRRNFFTPHRIIKSAVYLSVIAPRAPPLL